MATAKLGDLIREARTNAGLTQEKLGKQCGLTASDISKAERGEKDLTQKNLKDIARATGVTQASLLNAAKGTTAKKTTSSKSTATKSTGSKSTTTKPTAGKTTSANSTAGKTTATKSTTNKTTTAKKNSTTAKTTNRSVTTAERQLLDAFKEAPADARKAALYILKGQSKDLWDDIIRKHQGTDNAVANFINDVLGGLFNK